MLFYSVRVCLFVHVHVRVCACMCVRVFIHAYACVRAFVRPSMRAESYMLVAYAITTNPLEEGDSGAQSRWCSETAR